MDGAELISFIVIFTVFSTCFMVCFFKMCFITVPGNSKFLCRTRGPLSTHLEVLPGPANYSIYLPWRALIKDRERMPLDLQKEEEIRVDLDVAIFATLNMRLIYNVNVKIGNIHTFSKFVAERNKKKNIPTYGDLLFSRESIVYQTKEVVRDSIVEIVKDFHFKNGNEKIHDLLIVLKKQEAFEVEGFDIKIKDLRIKISVVLGVDDRLLKDRSEEFVKVEKLLRALVKN